MSQEEIIYEGKVPIRVFLFSHNILWILLLGWNIGLVAAILASWGVHVKVTSQRIVVTKGLVSQKAEEIEYYRVTDTAFEQGVLQRIFRVGEITLFADDKTCPKLVVPIHDPAGIREKIRECVRIEREKMKTVQMD